MLCLFKVTKFPRTHKDINVNEAFQAQLSDDYGKTIVNVYCETGEEALILADAFFGGEINLEKLTDTGLVGIKNSATEVESPYWSTICREG